MSKTTKTKEVKTDATFSFETVACMIAVYESGASTLGMAAYNKMAQLDGKRTACAFQHQFRDVKARARELAEELKAEKGSPSKDAVTPKKRGRKQADGAETGSNKKNKKEVKAEEDDETPAKFRTFDFDLAADADAFDHEMI